MQLARTEFLIYELKMFKFKTAWILIIIIMNQID